MWTSRVRTVLALSAVTSSAVWGCALETTTPTGEARAALVGDLVLDANEECEDGNTWGGDGCDPTGQIEGGWTCTQNAHPLALVNGGFEQPSGAPGNLCPPNDACYELTGTQLTGFVIDTGNVDYTTELSLWRCSHSNGCIDLTGTARGSLYQDLATVPGRTYRLHFDVAANALLPTAKRMAVSAANGTQPPHTQQHYVSFVPTNGVLPVDYDRQDFSFTATSAVTRLRFIGTDTSTNGAYVDNLVIPPSSCHRTNCGNGAVNALETCDDGNSVGGDGCSARCQIELGYTCLQAGQACVATCGDGLRTRSEACDDDNVLAGDGCSPTCTVEPGYNCNFANVLDFETTCTLFVCGDNQVDVPAESCDDGNTVSGDGCSATCQIETTDPDAGVPDGGVSDAGDDDASVADASDGPDADASRPERDAATSTDSGTDPSDPGTSTCRSDADCANTHKCIDAECRLPTLEGGGCRTAPGPSDVPVASALALCALLVSRRRRTRTR